MYKYDFATGKMISMFDGIKFFAVQNSCLNLITDAKKIPTEIIAIKRQECGKPFLCYPVSLLGQVEMLKPLEQGKNGQLQMEGPVAFSYRLAEMNDGETIIVIQNIWNTAGKFKVTIETIKP